MGSKMNSFEEKIKLPVTESISRFYQPQRNRKAIRIITVAVYVFCVSLAAIMLSLYYIFIWDPSVRAFVPKPSNCDKIVIPEQVAIRLINSTEISADQFFKNIFRHYQSLHKIKSYNTKDDYIRLPILMQRITESIRTSTENTLQENIPKSFHLKISEDDEDNNDDDDGGVDIDTIYDGSGQYNLKKIKNNI